MYSILSKRLRKQSTISIPEATTSDDLLRRISVESDLVGFGSEGSSVEELEPPRASKTKRRVMERKFRISPAILRNELENNDVYNKHYLEKVLLDEFLANLAMKEYVWQLSRADIQCFTREVIDKITSTLGEPLPNKINKDVLIDSIPTEDNFLVRIGHRIPSSDFLKLWRNYDTDHSGYLELRELRKLIIDFAEVVGEECDETGLHRALDELMETYDINRDGRLELEELSHLMSVEDNFMKMFCHRQYLTRRDFDKIFAHYDTDDTGYLDREEVMALLNDILKYQESKESNIPIPILKEVYKEVMKACDINNNETIQKGELALLLTSV